MQQGLPLSEIVNRKDISTVDRWVKTDRMADKRVWTRRRRGGMAYSGERNNYDTRTAFQGRESIVQYELASQARNIIGNKTYRSPTPGTYTQSSPAQPNR